MIQKTDLNNGSYKVRVTAPEFVPAAERRDMPFPPKFSENEWEAELSHTEDKTPAAQIRYTKRGGGVYVYSNNPEMLAPPDVGQALLRNEHLTGEIFFTYEHSNHTEEPFFIGYQLLNEGDTPVTVTVKSIGNQVRGEWLGQREWTDFYGVEFDLPEDYFLEDNKTVNPVYVGCDYVRYAPREYVPEVVTIQPGEYYWVLGGTSGDLFSGSHSGCTADQAILVGKCANGVVRFVVEGGDVTGTVWCYTDPKQCDREKPQQGYIINRDGKNYAAQYKGIDEACCGLLEAEISFIVSDETKAGRLPVKYTVERDPNWRDVTEPFAPLNLQTFEREGDLWLTSLNPNDNPTAVGTDMIDFKCVTTDGKEVIIDNAHTDGEGLKANTGNWMVQNTANYNLINVGDRVRHLKFFGRNTGVLAIMVRDEQGNLISKHLNMQPYNFDSPENVFKGVDTSLLVEKNGRWWFNMNGKPFCDIHDERSLQYEMDLPANSVVRISIDDLILANSNGGVIHWVEID